MEERAAQLFGAAASIEEELGIMFEDPFQEQAYERGVSAAKAALGEEAFASAWGRGEPMTLDEVRAFAEAE
jgi:hypothetical protein